MAREVGLFSVERQDEGAAGGVVAVFAEVDTLPGSQGGSAFADGDGNAAAEHAGFHMGGHVIGAFDGMDVGERFGDGMVHSSLEIGPHIGIGIFINGERCRGVLNEDVQQADFHARYLGDRLDDSPGNEVESSGKRGEFQSRLMPHCQTWCEGILVLTY